MSSQTQETKNAKAWGTNSAAEALAPMIIKRRAVQAHDVEIEIVYCGVCHSDLHTARNEWHGTVYPCVPGHEIVGRVVKTGNHVSRFKTGDLAAVGCMVDSCGECEHCKSGLEQYCLPGFTGTYNDPDEILGTRTYGGYSESIVVNERFVLRVPENLDLAATAPLLCAGITTYSPLRHWNAGPGKKVGIVGLGGLGHMAVKLARAMGAHVTVFTTSEAKRKDAQRLGAHEVVLSTNEDQMNKEEKSFDLIIDAVSASHDINALLKLLKLDGALALVGAPEHPLPVAAFNLLLPRRIFTGSAIGGIPETQEMLDFCGKHNIVSDIEMINISQINDAYERLLKGDVRYRFVIDMKSIRN
jgi:uncharacterized zinc-type alcohol dehydrogenase-like protein